MADVIGHTPGVDTVHNPSIPDMLERLLILARQNPDLFGCMLNGKTFTLSLKED